jgi:lipopolysaccharide transport system ATP-binding protein
MSATNTVVRVEDVSKCFRIGVEAERHENFVQALYDFIKSPLKNYRQYKSLYDFGGIDPNDPDSQNGGDVLWALRNVSFELAEGEVLGVVGHNGAGKSTLLKILSKITPPTKGLIEIKGRVSSLLEVGTGFHPELTGRENVYLNGIILGMRKSEIDRKFDEIVEFSGVEKFLDTPVKRYSSGMKVRLAFSVAAHLDPEIMIVDEVLAVGDVAFQNKCLGRMEKVAGEGRTVLFVSHNTGAISNLCTRAIWLQNGCLVDEGDVNGVLGRYLKEGSNLGKASSDEWSHEGSGEARIKNVVIKDKDGYDRDAFTMGDTIEVKLNIEFYEEVKSLPSDIAVFVSRGDTGMNVLHMTNTDAGFLTKGVTKGVHEYRVTIPDIMLYPGTYHVSVWVCGFDFVRNVVAFQVIQGAVSKRNMPFTLDRGVYHTKTLWREEPVVDDSV